MNSMHPTSHPALCNQNLSTDPTLGNASTAKNINKKTSQSPLIKQIWKIVEQIFKFALGTLLYWFNPALFAIGVIVGIVADDKIAEGMKKIKKVWDSSLPAICPLTCFACYLSLPVFLATSSFLYAAHFGSILFHNANSTQQ